MFDCQYYCSVLLSVLFSVLVSVLFSVLFSVCSVFMYVLCSVLCFCLTIRRNIRKNIRQTIRQNKSSMFVLSFFERRNYDNILLCFKHKTISYTNKILMHQVSLHFSNHVRGSGSMTRRSYKTVASPRSLCPSPGAKGSCQLSVTAFGQSCL